MSRTQLLLLISAVIGAAAVTIAVAASFGGLTGPAGATWTLVLAAAALSLRLFFAAKGKG